MNVRIDLFCYFKLFKIIFSYFTQLDYSFSSVLYVFYTPGDTVFCCSLWCLCVCDVLSRRCTGHLHNTQCSRHDHSRVNYQSCKGCISQASVQKMTIEQSLNGCVCQDYTIPPYPADLTATCTFLITIPPLPWHPTSAPPPSRIKRLVKVPHYYYYIYIYM